MGHKYLQRASSFERDYRFVNIQILFWFIKKLRVWNDTNKTRFKFREIVFTVKGRILKTKISINVWEPSFCNDFSYSWIEKSLDLVSQYICKEGSFNTPIANMHQMNDLISSDVMSVQRLFFGFLLTELSIFSFALLLVQFLIFSMRSFVKIREKNW